MKKLWIVSLILAGIACTPKVKVEFAKVFTSNMVLQQQTHTCLWGQAAAHEALTLHCSWIDEELKLQASADGTWRVQVPTPDASFEAHSIRVAAANGSEAMLSKVLIGEVWLCSGQSNMEMVLLDMPQYNLVVEHSAASIAAAHYPHIRYITLARKESFEPVPQIAGGEWKELTPESAQWLSAVGFFFAQQLQSELQVPVGLVVSAYGGSPIQSWIPYPLAASKPLYAPEVEARLQEMAAAAQSEQEYIEAMRLWVQQSGKGGLPASATPLSLPVNMERTTMGNQQGELVFVKEFEVMPQDMGKELHVGLGTMDDLGQVLFNGEQVWEELRNSHSYAQVAFTVPARKVKQGMNRIEVRVLNVLWGGGLTGPAEAMHYAFAGNEPVSLQGEWQYHKQFDLAHATAIPREGKPLFSSVASLYNGMIYPLAGYAVKGVLWYQGESNVGDEERYPLMMEDLATAWRLDFGEQIPFYYVQIAPYEYATGTQAGALRNAQQLAGQHIGNTGMVVTLDIGDAQNIHPAKKKEVGQRLANMALGKTYARPVAYEFPHVATATRKASSVSLSFAGLEGQLVLHGKEHSMELSENGLDFVPARVTQTGESLRLDAPTLRNPQYVRYGYQDASKATVFNTLGLPLGTFLIKTN